ncbi:MAG: NB-ARC domain-containing protein [Candidatus Tectomicrobia bacterium]
MSTILRLEVTDYQDPWHWCWRLGDDQGNFLGDHEVHLSQSDWQYQAFLDLYDYIRLQVAPDKRQEEEQRIVAALGAWLGEHVLGPLAEKIVADTPVTVHVVIPADVPGAIGLMYRPLELTHVSGKPLAVQDVSLVFDLRCCATPPQTASKPIGTTQRLRAVCSRVGVLARASQALAPHSGATGVLLHGIAGAGKTTCALELVYQHEEVQRFQGLVWYQAPSKDQDINQALLDFALAMERQLPGFAMAHMVGRHEAFTVFLPRLVALLESRSILIVLDNLESLLWPHGQWRDARWGRLIAALLAHQGESRTILTSRLVPQIPEDVGFSARVRAPVTFAMHELSRQEAAQLALQLPNLGRLPWGEARHNGRSADARRRLVAETPRVVLGHPTLIELAESQAVDPHSLRQHLERASQAWARSQDHLGALCRHDAAKLSDEEFPPALFESTNAVAESVPLACRTLFHFLCAMEEADRNIGIIESNWPDLWQRLELAGEPPELTPALALLVTAGLVEAVQLPLSSDDEAEDQAVGVYRIHPGVSKAARQVADKGFQAAVDVELSAFWGTVFRCGIETEASGGGRLITAAGRRTTPYLMRQQQWREASTLLDRVVLRDRSPEMIALVLPLLQHIAEATQGTVEGLLDAGVLANALLEAGRWQEAEAKFWDIVKRAEELGEFCTAGSVVGYIINIMRSTGRSQEALALVEQKKAYTRRAGPGP